MWNPLHLESIKQRIVFNTIKSFPQIQTGTPHHDRPFHRLRTHILQDSEGIIHTNRRTKSDLVFGLLSFQYWLDTLVNRPSKNFKPSSIGPELNRRLGAARAEFQTLCRVWNHAVLPKAEKIRIFEACVPSKLLYCLHTAWLNKAELRRLNAFQAKCVRKILNIPHSFVSRISNKIVLEQSGRQEISSILTYRQLVFFGKIAALPSTDVRRQCVFSWSNPSAPDCWTAAAPRTP